MTLEFALMNLVEAAVLGILLLLFFSLAILVSLGVGTGLMALMRKAGKWR